MSGLAPAAAAAAVSARKPPFLPGVIPETLGRGGLTVSDLLHGASCDAVRREAVNRVISAETGRQYCAVGGPVVMIGGMTYRQDVLTYVVASAICNVKGDRVLTKKFALSESVTAEPFLRGHPSPEDLVSEMASIKALRDGAEYRVPVADYLPLACRISSMEWKLVNQRVTGGYVMLAKRRMVRLVRHAMAAYVIDQVNGMSLGSRDVEALAGYAAKVGTTHVWAGRRPPADGGRLPPCIAHCRQQLKEGENLPHVARFLLASYLLKAGTPADDIAVLFQTAPDYNEAVTKYQIGQIARSEYLPPSCAKVETAGWCRRSEACGNIANPIQFGRHDGRVLQEDENDTPVPEEKNTEVDVP